MNEDSMLYWYPKIKNLNIPQPKTLIIELDEMKELYPLLDFEVDKLDKFKNSETFKKIKEAVNNLGYPIFIRTDMASGKHDWKTSCFYDGKEGDAGLISHILRVYEFNKIADIMGLPVEALIFREYIPMKNLFTAFYGEMPVNPEIRFFIKDGNIVCWHWYWIEEAIENPSIPNWREVMKRVKDEVSGNEIMWLNNDVRKVADVFHKGYWSIDFCKGRDDKWYLIDMASGIHSWHEEGCPNKITLLKEGS